MKNLGFLFLLFLGSSAFASDVAPCESGDSELEDIAEDKGNTAYLVIDIKNAKGEIVGAITAYAAGPRKMEMAALKLCGQNANNYYGSGNLISDLSQDVGVSADFGFFYDDEYEINSSAVVLSRNKNLVLAKLEMEIFFKPAIEAAAEAEEAAAEAAADPENKEKAMAASEAAEYAAEAADNADYETFKTDDLFIEVDFN